MKYLLYIVSILIGLFFIRYVNSTIKETALNDSHKISRFFNKIPELNDKRNKLVVFNVNTRDFNPSGGRIIILKKIIENITNLGIPIKLVILIKKNNLTTNIKKLIKINNLDSNYIVLDDNIRNFIRENIHHSIIMLDSDNNIKFCRDISDPHFKKEFYLQFFNNPISELYIPHSLQLNEKNDTSLTIHNKCKDPLYVFEVEGSCGCLDINLKDKIISPGDSTRLFLKFRENTIKSLQNIVIYSNDKQVFHNISITLLH